MKIKLYKVRSDMRIQEDIKPHNNLNWGTFISVFLWPLLVTMRIENVELKRVSVVINNTITLYKLVQNVDKYFFMLIGLKYNRIHLLM